MSTLWTPLQRGSAAPLPYPSTTPRLPLDAPWSLSVWTNAPVVHASDPRVQDGGAHSRRPLCTVTTGALVHMDTPDGTAMAPRWNSDGTVAGESSPSAKGVA